MSVSEFQRHEVFKWLEGKMGPERAAIMMDLLPRSDGETSPPSGTSRSRWVVSAARCKLVLVHDVVVEHLLHDGRITRHERTPEARRHADHVVYDVGVAPPLFTPET